jgi:hypothetical protein
MPNWLYWRMAIPFLLETARLLAALIRPNHLVRLSSWGLIHLPPCNSNGSGYKLAAVYGCKYLVCSLVLRQLSFDTPEVMCGSDFVYLFGF